MPRGGAPSVIAGGGGGAAAAAPAMAIPLELDQGLRRRNNAGAGAGGAEKKTGDAAPTNHPAGNNNPGTTPARGANANSPWLAFISEDVGMTMYYNTLTEETTWREPAVGFTWGESHPGRTPMLDPESLGDDYLDSAWVEPSLDTALEAGRKSVCLQGRASLCTDISDMSSIGEAGLVYLHFVKGLVVTFCVMSLLYLPALLTSVTGSRLPPDQVDFLSQFSVANIGDTTFLDCSSPTPDREACERQLLDAKDAFSTGPFWPEGKSVADVASILVWLDVVAMIVFTLASIHFFHAANEFSHLYRLRATTVCDYAVQVWGLPPDALESEIIDHFHELYNLQVRLAWCASIEGSNCCSPSILVMFSHVSPHLSYSFSLFSLSVAASGPCWPAPMRPRAVSGRPLRKHLRQSILHQLGGRVYRGAPDWCADP